MGKSLAVVLPTLALALGACGNPVAVEPVQQVSQSPRRVTLQGHGTAVEYVVYPGNTVGDSRVSGDESPYEVYVPADYAMWDGNGRRLALYTHGYTDPIDYPVGTYDIGGGLTGRQPLPQAVNSALSGLQKALVDNHFAFAWSAYDKPGYAVKSGIASTNELIDIADKKLKEHHKKTVRGFLSKRRYVLGHSLGGIIGAGMAEKYASSRVSGVLAMCGPVNGMTQQVKYAGDLRALYDHYFQNNYRSGATQIPTADPLQPAVSPVSDGELKALGWSITASTTTSGTTYGYTGLAAAIADAVKANLAAAQELASVDQIELKREQDDAATSVNEGQEQLVHSIVDALFYPVRGVSDALSTAGGSPFNNSVATTTYTGTGTVEGDKALNDSILRYEPTSTKPTSYVAANYDTTGSLQTRVLTLHTTMDPQVPFWHEERFAAKVKAKSKSSNLAQQYVERYGHCSMNETETGNALNALVTWVESFGFIRPETGDVTK